MKLLQQVKTKSFEKQDQTNKYQEIYISSEKRQQMIDALRLFQTLYKNGILKKNINLLDTTSDNVPRFVTKK